MPGIEQIQSHNTLDATRARIAELKTRAAEGLDDALTQVARNLGRKETAAAHGSLKELEQQLAGPDAPSHHLDHATVMNLISDPFAEG